MRDAVDLAATVTAGIPTACVDAPSTAADGNDRFAADEGTETQLRATAPATSSALTPVKNKKPAWSFKLKSFPTALDTSGCTAPSNSIIGVG